MSDNKDLNQVQDFEMGDEDEETTVNQPTAKPQEAAGSTAGEAAAKAAQSQQPTINKYQETEKATTTDVVQKPKVDPTGPAPEAAPEKPKTATVQAPKSATPAAPSAANAAANSVPGNGNVAASQNQTAKTAKAAPAVKKVVAKAPVNPAARKKAVLGCLGAFGGALVLMLILSFVFIAQADGSSSPIAEMLNIEYATFVNGLITFIHLIFICISLIAFVFTMIGLFKASMARKDDKETRKQGLKAAAVSGVSFFLIIMIWLFVYLYLDEKRVTVNTVVKDPIVTEPEDTLDLSAPIEVKFDASNVPYESNKYRIVSHEWDFGDGETGTSQIVSHIFEEKGTYKVSLKLTFEDKSTGELIPGGEYTKTVSITNQALAAIFTADPQSGEAPLEVEFDASDSVDPDGYIDRYEWDLDGDGDYDDATGVSLTHEFEKVGKYTVGLRVVSTTDEFAVSEKEIDVKKGEDPEPVITIIDEPSEFIKNVSYVFKADESSSPNGKIVEYEWNFGDGSDTINTKSTSHAFDTEGTYEVVLKVVDEDEKEAETVKIISIGSPKGSPKAKLTTDPAMGDDDLMLTGTVPFTVVFDASGTTDSDNNIIDYEWDFGDTSQAAYGQTVSHTFMNEGTYTTILTVTDADDHVSKVTQVVSVEAQGIIADIEADTIEGSVPLTVSFDAGGSSYQAGQITTYKWDFGDGTAEKTGPSSINHQYTSIGFFTATVTAIGSDNTRDTATINITVRDIPLSACFVSVFEEGPAPLETSFDPSCATGSISSYLWDFGDGSTSTQVKPIHIFEDPGEYRVTLKVTDSDNNVDTHELYITVN